MIELNEQQCQEQQAPEPIAVDPATRETYVLVRKEIYDRFKEHLYDDSAWTDEEMDLLAAESADALGWEGMEVYQDTEGAPGRLLESRTAVGVAI